MPTISNITPLIGREDELARLSGLLERARSGESRAVLIAGDAGVGKTRMLDEMAGRAAAAGMTVLTGHCVDLGDVGLPYLPFTEVLGVLAADERFADALAAHPVIDRLLGGGTDAVRDLGGRLRLFEGIAGVLADLADISPLLLVLEDLHWADQSSRDLLRFLLSRGVLQRAAGGVPTHRLAVFASYRADDLHRRHPLRPLLVYKRQAHGRRRGDAAGARGGGPSAARGHGPADRRARRGQRLLRGGTRRGHRHGGRRGAQRARGRPPHPLRAAVRDGPAGAAHGRGRGPPCRARPAAAGRGAPRGRAGVGAARGRGAATAGPRRGRHVRVPARPGPRGGVRGPAARRAGPAARRVRPAARRPGPPGRERGRTGPPLPGEPRPARGAGRVAGSRGPRPGGRRARRGATPSRSRPRPVVGGGTDGTARRRRCRPGDPHAAGVGGRRSRRRGAPGGLPHPGRARGRRPGRGLRAGRPGAVHARREPAERRQSDGGLRLQQRGARPDPRRAPVPDLGVGGGHTCDDGTSGG